MVAHGAQFASLWTLAYLAAAGAWWHASAECPAVSNMTGAWSHHAVIVETDRGAWSHHVFYDEMNGIGAWCHHAFYDDVIEEPTQCPCGRGRPSTENQAVRTHAGCMRDSQVYGAVDQSSELHIGSYSVLGGSETMTTPIDEAHKQWQYQWEQASECSIVKIYVKEVEWLHRVVDYDYVRRQLLQPIARRLRRALQPNPWSSVGVLCDPSAEGECFFEAVRAHMELQHKPRSSFELRKDIAAYMVEAMPRVLATAAYQEQVTPAAYVGALCRGLWGGAPEAKVVARLYGYYVTAETPHGRMLYQFGDPSSHVWVRLGYRNQHYVALWSATRSVRWLRMAYSWIMMHTDGRLQRTTACRGGGRSRSRPSAGPKKDNLVLRSRSRHVRHRHRHRRERRADPAGDDRGQQEAGRLMHDSEMRLQSGERREGAIADSRRGEGNVCQGRDLPPLPRRKRDIVPDEPPSQRSSTLGTTSKASMPTPAGGSTPSSTQGPGAVAKAMPVPDGDASTQGANAITQVMPVADGQAAPSGVSMTPASAKRPLALPAHVGVVAKPVGAHEDLHADAAYVHQVFTKEMKLQADRIQKELAEDIINTLVPDAKPGPRLAMRVVIMEALRGDPKASPDGIRMVMKFLERQRTELHEKKHQERKDLEISQTTDVADDPAGSGARSSREGQVSDAGGESSGRHAARGPAQSSSRNDGDDGQQPVRSADDKVVRGVRVNPQLPLQDQGVPFESDIFDEYEESWLELRGWQGSDASEKCLYCLACGKWATWDHRQTLRHISRICHAEQSDRPSDPQVRQSMKQQRQKYRRGGMRAEALSRKEVTSGLSSSGSSLLVMSPTLPVSWSSCHVSSHSDKERSLRPEGVAVAQSARLCSQLGKPLAIRKRCLHGIPREGKASCLLPSFFLCVRQWLCLCSLPSTEAPPLGIAAA